LGEIWEKRKKGEEQMKNIMNQDRRIPIILVTLVVVALLATIWAITGPLASPMPGSPIERQGWERLFLTDVQRNELEQMMERMRENGTSMENITRAVDAKIRGWNVRLPPPGDIELFYTIKTVVSTVNVALVIILLLTYIEIYRRTKSNFTVGLMIFSIILLFYTLTSNPITQWLFGFSAFGLGPFAMLPDLFACVALSVLVYLSVKY
jgi:hypothetical protein